MGKFLMAVTVFFGAAVLLALTVAWPVMLLWGAIAGTYDLPTAGFGTTIQGCLLVGILLNLGTANSKQ